MKLLVLLALIVATSAKNADQSVITAEFNRLLEQDGVTLPSGPKKAFRLAEFTLSYLSMPDDGVPNLDMMFSENEDSKRNGAKMNKNVRPNHEIQKREESRLLEIRAPPVYNARTAHAINDAVNQLECGNCYLHVFVAALEIAYTKVTGELLKFSEQEMTDCYYAGCGGGDYRMVTVLMTFLDKLSLRANYGPYMDGVYTCRASTTPDALSKIQAVEYVDVTTDNVEQAVSDYGSVMTCMAWGTSASDPCYFKNYESGTVIDEPAVPEGDGCAHAVLIVGYTPTYYIVRNSHGKSWGDQGYFQIKRNTNSCGIEKDMAALVVKVRTAPKTLIGSNGCPVDKPKLCDSIYTCVPEDEDCIEPDNKKLEKREEKRNKGGYEVIGEKREVVEEEQEKREEKRNKGGYEVIGEKREFRETAEKKEEREEQEKREEKRNKGGYEVIGEKREVAEEEDLEEREDGKQDRKKIKGLQRKLVPGRERLLEKRAAMIELEKRCTDSNPGCPNFVAFCDRIQVQALCAQSCGTCDSEIKEENLPPDTDETVGKCYKPTIANGQVSNSDDLLSYGEELVVRCDAGYELTGETVHCLIQNIFTNSDNSDARLVPECIKNTGESLVGNGEAYSGTRAVVTVNGEQQTCSNWNVDVLKGIYMADYDAGKLLEGNHNFCRNPGDEPVPMCLYGAPALGYYCFQYPGCDVCSGSDTDATPSCGASKCEYSTLSKRGTVDWYWTNCKATCCQKAGC